MATFQLADVQQMITAAVAQYKLLLGTNVYEYTESQRSVHKHKLAELREEITQLSMMEATMAGGPIGGMNALVQFGEQV